MTQKPVEKSEVKEMKKSLCILLALTTLFCISCQNEILSDEASLSQAEKDAIRNIAQVYIQNERGLNNIAQGRSITASTNYYEEFENRKIKTPQGEVLFKDLTESQQAVIIKNYQEQELEQFIEKLEENADFLEMVKLENAAFTYAKNATVNRNGTTDFETFMNNYESYLNRKTIFSQTRASSSKITEDCMNPKSVETLKPHYGIGKIFVCTDSSSSSSSSYIGHASLMRFKNWQEIWNKNGMGMATITSSPDDKSAQWEGKEDGVQYEPIGYWAGTASCSANKVTVLDVLRTEIEYYEDYDEENEEYFMNSRYIHVPTTYEDHVKAYNNAEKYLGKPYPRLFKKAFPWNNKKNKDVFYCSQLIWRAWYDVDNDCTLSTALYYISPSNLVKSSNSKVLVKYSNK